jgi:hypothetical protein
LLIPIERKTKDLQSNKKTTDDQGRSPDSNFSRGVPGSKDPWKNKQKNGDEGNEAENFFKV